MMCVAMANERMWRPLGLAATLLCAAAAGCLGSIGEGGDRAGQPAKPLGEDFEPGQATIHLLTSAQLTNAYRAAFGEPLDVVLDLPQDDQLYGFTSIAAASRTISPVEAEKYEAAAYMVIDYVWSDPSRREAFVGCAPASVADLCVRDFVTSQGRRLWRRPIEASEATQLIDVGVSVEAATGDTWDALRYVTATMLQSPHFVFRIETGAMDEESGFLKFTGWEMASRLSFLIQDVPPDDALLDAAERGELDTLEGVREHAARLVEEGAARAALVRFFRDFMNINRLDDIDKSPTLFPMLTDTLGESMRTEIERMFEDNVFDGGGDFRQLFTTGETFVNEELAGLYGIDGVTGGDFVPAAFPNAERRAGLLTTAGFLAMNAHKTATSPTHRGRFVRINLLCQDVPPPPPGVNTALEPPTGGAVETLRERLEQHRVDPACQACHALMDPIGFAFEHYDAIGMWRDLDNGLDIDASSEVEGTAVDGGVEVGAVIAAMPEVAACVAQRFYQHANGRLDGRSEKAAVDQLADRFVASEYNFKRLVLDMVESDGFRFASTQTTDGETP